MLGAQNGMALTAFNSANVSGLAHRFAHPAAPGNPTAWKLLGWWLVIFLMWLFIEAIPFSNAWVTDLIMVFPAAFFLSGVLAFGLTLLIGYLGLKTSRAKRWRYAVNTLRNSLYCSWCDVGFSRDFVSFPEEFVQHVFYDNVPYAYLPIAR
jgi:hypothetical protein